jgi:hypothetical protein
MPSLAAMRRALGAQFEDQGVALVAGHPRLVVAAPLLLAQHAVNGTARANRRVVTSTNCSMSA